MSVAIPDPVTLSPRSVKKQLLRFGLKANGSSAQNMRALQQLRDSLMSLAIVEAAAPPPPPPAPARIRSVAHPYRTPSPSAHSPPRRVMATPVSPDVDDELRAQPRLSPFDAPDQLSVPVQRVKQQRVRPAVLPAPVCAGSDLAARVMSDAYLWQGMLLQQSLSLDTVSDALSAIRIAELSPPLAFASHEPELAAQIRREDWSLPRSRLAVELAQLHVHIH